jgi:hypothetical protein
MARRDDNWRKLRQYVLDEREEMELRGPARTIIWGERREYTWYIRDGFFVQSPLKVNGAAVGESDRRKYEADFLQRERAREKAESERAARSDRASSSSPEVDCSEPRDRDAQADAPAAVPRELDGLLIQTRQPRFITSAYILRFKFEKGRYALVGRETLAAMPGRELLRVEYYPARLFREQRCRPRRESDERMNAAVQRLLNKGSRVTLWIDQPTHQIVQYTFDNVDLEFLPAQWFATLTGLHATMTMGEPFPDVWLPRTLALDVGVLLAAGVFEFRYDLEYHDYRKADVTSTIRVPER